LDGQALAAAETLVGVHLGQTGARPSRPNRKPSAARPYVESIPPVALHFNRFFLTFVAGDASWCKLTR
jgi:hypothetical protein